MAKEKARAHVRFDQVTKKRKVDDRDERPHTSSKSSSSSSTSSSSSSESESEDAVPEPVETESVTPETAEAEKPLKEKRNRMEKRDRDEIQKAKAAGVEVGASKVADLTQKKSKSKKRRKKEQQQPAKDGAGAAEEGSGIHHYSLTSRSSNSVTETILPSKTSQPPLGHSAAFQALLKGPLPKKDKGNSKSKRLKRRREERAAEGESKGS